MGCDTPVIKHYYRVGEAGNEVELVAYEQDR